MVLWFFSFLVPLHLHEYYADKDPDDLTDAADDADEDAEGGGETEDGDGEYEAAFLHAELHGQEADDVCEERGEGEDEDAVGEVQQQACGAAAAVDAKEEKHEEDLEALYYAREILQQQAGVERTLVLTVEGGNLTVDVEQRLTVAFREATAPAFQAGDAASPSQHLQHQAVLVALGEDIERCEAECCYQREDDGDGRRQRQVAYEDKGEV